MAVKLFAHNLKAYRAACSMLEIQGRAAIVHPTGTGKSYIAFALCADHPDTHILWLSPSEYIYKTQREALHRSNPELSLENIQFMTYAKLSVLPEAEYTQIIQSPPDYMILDEFHRAGAAVWGEAVTRLIAHCPQTKLLGLSATSVRYLDNQRDMAEILFNGLVASEMTLGEAIARGILPAPKYVTTVYRVQQEVARYQARVDNLKSPGIRDINQECLDALRRALQKADGLERVFKKHMENRRGKYIVFCANYEHMQEMIAHVPEWFGGIDPEPHVYTAYADDPETNSSFARFKADGSDHLKLLFCIDMLNEGVHIKGVSGVILFRPTISPIVYKQQIGRALTAGEGGTPLILDIVNNFENLISISAVQEEMQCAIQQMIHDGEGDAIAAQRFEIVEQVRDCRLLFEQLQNSLSSTWEQYYTAASIYQAEHGDLNVPLRYKTPTGLSLGSWLTIQRLVRSGRRPGNLTQRQIERLDALGFCWENRLELAWERNYDVAKHYYEQYGNLLVPAKYVTPDGVALGTWIAAQRVHSLDDAQRTVMNPERISRLEQIGMVWDAVSERWESNYAQALHYYHVHGDLQVKAGYKTESGFALGAWIRNLRRSYSGQSSGRPLTQEQINRLEAIGMIWDKANDTQWQTVYEEAKRYAAHHGNLAVPVDYVAPNGIALGKWICRQRNAYNHPESESARLDSQRIEKLNDLHMDWRETDAWTYRCQLVEQYKADHGNINIPAKYKTTDGIWLGNWLYRQRKLRDAGKLTQQQAERLNALECTGTVVSFRGNGTKEYTSAAAVRGCAVGKKRAIG